DSGQSLCYRFHRVRNGSEPKEAENVSSALVAAGSAGPRVGWRRSCPGVLFHGGAGQSAGPGGRCLPELLGGGERRERDQLVAARSAAQVGLAVESGHVPGRRGGRNRGG